MNGSRVFEKNVNPVQLLTLIILKDQHNIRHDGWLENNLTKITKQEPS